jgi:phage shock protein C
MNSRRIYRSDSQKIIAGVCGGIGEYFNIDPVLVRIGWVVITLLGGAGILAYLIAWFIIPLGVNDEDSSPERRTKGCLFIVLAIILIGVLIPVVVGILRFVFAPFHVGFGHFSGLGFLIGSIFFVIGVIAVIVAVAVIVFLLRKSGDKKDD